MNVLYTCDNNYVWLMGISTISMFENNKELENLEVYLLGENISEENRQLLFSIGEKYNRNIIILDVPHIDIPEALVSSRWPISAFTRLYSGELLPKSLDKILYLDCDTIINGELKELDSWNVENYIFWGIKDCVGKEYKKNIGIGQEGLYVNAGVLLINLSALRETPISEKLTNYITNYEKLINYADQDILNGAFLGNIGALPPKYDVMTIVATYDYKDIEKLRKPTNYYSENEIVNAVNNPTIIHYTTNMRTVRPWFSNTNHPMAHYFQKYLEISPWKDKELSEMKFNTNESKIIGIIEKLPKGIAKSVLGILHSSIKPRIIRLKAKKRRKKDASINNNSCI